MSVRHLEQEEVKKQEMKSVDAASMTEERRAASEDSRELVGGLREGRAGSPFAQLLQDVKDLLWLFGQTVLAQLLHLPAT